MSRTKPPALQLCIRCGWPTDPLTWLLAAPSLLILGGMVAGLCGLFVTVLLSLLTADLSVAIVVGLLTFLVTIYKWAHNHFRVNAEYHEFFEDRLVSHIESEEDARRLQTITTQYSEIGTVQYDRIGKIRLWFGIAGTPTRANLEIRVARLAATDQFDEIVSWIETACPDHLFAADGQDGCRYSRPWSLRQLFPDLAPVRGVADVERVYDHSKVRVGDQSFRFKFVTFSEILVYRDSPADTEPLLSAMVGFRENVPEIRIANARGLIIAASTTVPNRVLKIQVEEDRELDWDLVNGQVYLDGETMGRVRRLGYGARVELEGLQEQPEVLILLLTICFSSGHVLLPELATMPQP